MKARGDMAVLGEPSAALTKALAVIADRLHPEFDKVVIPSKSKNSCILCSLAVRDFLRAVGFGDAKTKVVWTAIEATKEDALLHSLGIGHPEQPDTGDGWVGHMVVTVKSENYLIDTTLYQAVRPAWPDLPRMLALPMAPFKKLLTACRLADDGDYLCKVAWMKNPKAEHTWLDAPDAGKERREPVVSAMLEAYAKNSVVAG